VPRLRQQSEGDLVRDSVARYLRSLVTSHQRIRTAFGIDHAQAPQDRERLAAAERGEAVRLTGYELSRVLVDAAGARMADFADVERTGWWTVESDGTFHKQ
jgi:hypothetical protein